MNKREFGALVKTKRAERGMTQRDLAALSGMNRATLQMIEGGEQWPGVRFLAELRRHLGIDVNAVLDAIPAWLADEDRRAAA
jgi:transcriptional regulator with XRE-family HTH domain